MERLSFVVQPDWTLKPEHETSPSFRGDIHMGWARFWNDDFAKDPSGEPLITLALPQALFIGDTLVVDISDSP